MTASQADSALVTADLRRTSPFFYPPPSTQNDSLAILHLRRDSLLTVTLKEKADDGYAEGAVTNTRFGSFPHSTLIGLEWGSQVRASKVDTGTRGRKGKKGKQGDVVAAKGPALEDGDAREWEKTKRKSDLLGDDDADGEHSVKKPKYIIHADARGGPLCIDSPVSAAAAVKTPVEAGSGFIHILQPTPEAWTSSLDHRTQVVYTPDYSYILQRLRVRPGSAVIEAGAGSGSFTHAAARAVFSGYPAPEDASPKKKRKLGRVYSYEFHEPRVQTLGEELSDHGLNGIVHLKHRDVCAEGFALPDATSPNADAVFLDLPAPWLALKHLTRTSSAESTSCLNPNCAIHLCTFSPCIEQVMATVSALRKAGWIEIEMVEVQNKRIDVRREHVGLRYEGLRGVNASAASVEEALSKLRDVESKLLDFHASKTAVKNGSPAHPITVSGKGMESKQERLRRIQKEAEELKLYNEGNLVHRTEPEVKTHTSYLVFAVLPKDWSEADEQACLEKQPVDEVMKVSLHKEYTTRNETTKA